MTEIALPIIEKLVNCVLLGAVGLPTLMPYALLNVLYATVMLLAGNESQLNPVAVKEHVFPVIWTREQPTETPSRETPDTP